MHLGNKKFHRVVHFASGWALLPGICAGVDVLPKNKVGSVGTPAWIEVV